MALTPQMLARLEGLKVRARAVVDGVLSGLHKSPHQGQSVEFAEHKEYAPGDELRHLDWKALAKFDKYYIKRFEHETNLRSLLVVDGSGSMGFGSGPLTKLDAARTLAAALGYLLIRQQDAAGVTVLHPKLVEVPPRTSANHINALLETLQAANAEGPTDLYGASEHLAERAPRRSLIVLFSDLFDDRADALPRFLGLRSRKHDVAVFHILDPAELEFPFDDPTLFLSMEDERNVEVNPREIKQSYLEEMQRFLAETKKACTAADVDYELVRTDQPLDTVLSRFLARRMGKS
ncbi:MAG: DUF58 domain-containing protein [Myxococcaceae bacterium]